VEYAAQCGASVVSIIPVRGGTGEMERLEARGEFTPPVLSQLEAALDRCLHLTDTVVTVDLWDVEQLRACGHCRVARVDRLQRLNLSGHAEPRLACRECGTT
jgi:hypothetical protein